MSDTNLRFYGTAHRNSYGTRSKTHLKSQVDERLLDIMQFYILSDTNLRFYGTAHRNSYGTRSKTHLKSQVDERLLDIMQFYILSNTNLSFFMHFTSCPTPT